MSILVKSKIVRTEAETKYMYISYISTCREFLYNKFRVLCKELNTCMMMRKIFSCNLNCICHTLWYQLVNAVKVMSVLKPFP